MPNTDSYERQFRNLLRLVLFSARHDSEFNSGKRIKILAFGHENYIRPFLNEYFADTKLDNVETIKVAVGDDEVIVERRGERKQKSIRL